MKRLTIVILAFSLYLALAPIPALAATTAGCGAAAATNTSTDDLDQKKIADQLARLVFDAILKQITTETDDERVKLQKRLAVLGFGWMVIAAGMSPEDTILEKCGVDADGDGRRDIYVAFATDSWLGLADVTGDGRVDYVWLDKNGDRTPQTEELRRRRLAAMAPPQLEKSQGPQSQEGPISEKGPNCR